MEKKTIGGFISTLRKANGMTQKELAERLNVSDKTISRWERDDGAPDLALIPVIAEIFNVTCDELLRGERKSPTERAEMPEDNEISPKGEMIWSAHNLSSFYGITFDDYDSFVMHQANGFILQMIAKKLKADFAKFPICLDRYGNTSAPSIPLAICDKYGNSEQNADVKFLMSGFGVGLSWGVCSITINTENIYPVIETNEIFTEGVINSLADFIKE